MQCCRLIRLHRAAICSCIGASMKIYLALTVLVTILNLQICRAEDKNISPRLRTMPILEKQQKFTRSELQQLWKGMKKDPEAEDDNDKGVMGKSKYIIDGKEATRGQFPWQAAMILDDEHFCGGSLITTKHVLSAAHCAEEVSMFFVTLGAQKRKEDEDGRATFYSSTSTIHPRWDTNLVKNDISIITSPEDIVLNEFIKLVRLPRRSAHSRTLVKLKGTVSGFGLTADGAKNVSDVLNFVQMKIVPNAECVRLYGKESVTRTNLCVRGIKSNAKGTCNGDSGGPFVIKEKDGSWTQHGLVSYGAASGCGKGYPDVMTRVSAFLSFIEENANVQIRA